ncbi:MAG: hypothetical protein ACI9Z3_000332, partial [Roseivirga sp.]
TPIPQFSANYLQLMSIEFFVAKDLMIIVRSIDAFVKWRLKMVR